MSSSYAANGEEPPMSQCDPAELIEFLRTLRQTRGYLPEPVNDAMVQRVLEVARWTGSGGNRQPWRLVVVQEAERRAALAKSKADIAWLADAPVVIGIVTEGKTWETARFDAGRMVERIMLAAKAQGLAAAVVGFGAPESDPEVVARQALNVPEGSWITHAVAIGHAMPEPSSGTNSRAGRKPLSEIVVQEKFG
jgi:nitroreductase